MCENQATFPGLIYETYFIALQMPQYVISYDERVFQPDLHVRYPHLSCPTSDSVKTYLWPALREGKDGPCVHKAVIVT